MEPVIKQLDSSVVNILCSAQVITSPSSVIKELVENSLDAKATNIDVKLETFGLEKIEVRDNGTGVKSEDAKCMAASHYTSKLVCFNDLMQITTYGFRGEALSSISSIGDLTIATKNAEEVGISYKYDHCGNVIAHNPVAMNQGTSVIVTKLFKTLPVRRQYFSSINKRKEEIKNVENLLKAYSIINCSVRFSLYHDMHLTWQKGRSDDVKASLQQVFGISLLKGLDAIHYKSPDGKICISAFLPKKNSNIQLMSHSKPDMTFVFVNRRPVTMKFAHQILKKCYSTGHGLLGMQMRYPIGCMCIELPTEAIDVNIDPSKSQVYFHEKEDVMKAVNLMLENLYDLPETPTAGLNTQMNTTNLTPHSTGVLNHKIKEKAKHCQTVESVNDMPATMNMQDNRHNTLDSLSALLDDDLGIEWEIMKEESEVACSNGIKDANGLPNTSNVEQNAQLSSQNVLDKIVNSSDSTNKTLNLNSSQWSKGCIRDNMGEIIKPPQIFLGKEKKGLSKALPELEIIECPMKKKARLDNSTNLTMDSFLENCTQNVNLATQSSPTFDANKGVQSAKVVNSNTARDKRRQNNASQKLQSVCEKRQNKLSFIQKDVQKSTPVQNESSEPIKSAVVQFSFDQMKSDLFVSQSSSLSSTNESTDKEKIDLIGELDNGFWIILQENQLKILNHHRLSEVLLYRRLMEQHAIAKQHLQQSIVLTGSKLGEKEWQVLTSLAVPNIVTDAPLPIVDSRIVKNGFGINRCKDTAIPSTTTLILEEVANHIPFYGISELQECLTYIASNPSATLSESRPMKVVNYLKGESVRMARAMPNRKTNDDLLMILKDATQNLPHDLNRCCHGHPFFTSIYNLENKPEIMDGNQ